MADDPPNSLKRLGDYDLLRELGRGGMGVVYEARQISLNRRIALKVLPPNLGLTPNAVRRFKREARAAAKLHHTNIVPVHAIGEEDGHHFYAMDLIEGDSLDRVLRALVDEGSHPLMEATVTKTVAGLSPRTGASSQADVTRSQECRGTSLSDTSAGGREWFDAVAKLVAEVADGLEYAHGRGVIHRDIKPANLMLAKEGRLCIVDFGLARMVREPSMTVSGSFLGTPAYMSPEQIAAGRAKLDQRTDIYSLGVVLYEMLTLQRPFPGESREEIVTAIMTKDPRPPRRLNSRIPIDLETICLKAMEKDPDRRYRTAGEMGHDLQEYLRGGLIAARRAGVLRRAAKSVRRHPVLALGLVAALAIAAIAGFAWQQSRGRTTEAAKGAVANARYYLSQGEYDKGLERADAALAADPGMLDARLLRARFLMKLDRYAEAVAEAERILQDGPDDWTGHLILAMAAKFDQAPEHDEDEHLQAVATLAPKTAEAFYLRGLFDDSAEAAIPLLDEALRLDPSHADALAERSRRHVERKNFQAALMDGERLASLRPKSAWGRLLVASVHDELDDPERARIEYDAAVALDPNDPIAYRSRGWHFSGQGREHEALADMTRAVELDPDNAASRAARGWIYANLGELEQAVADGKWAVELDPDLESSYSLLNYAYTMLDRPDDRAVLIEQLRRVSAGWKDKERLASVFLEEALMHYRQGNTEEAGAAATEVLKLRPDWPTGYFIRIWLRKAADDPVGVKSDCDRLAAMDATKLDDLLRMGQVFADLCGRLDEGIETYSEIIDRAPHWADAYSWRAFSYWWWGRFEEAAADYDQAIKLAPRSGGLAADHATFLVDMERLEEALAEFDRSLALGYEEPWIDCERSRLLFRLGRAEEGLARFDRLIEERPNYAYGYECRASTLLEFGRIEEALGAAKKAIELEPGGWSAYWLLIQTQLYSTEQCDDVLEAVERLLQHGRGDFWLPGYESLLHARLFFHFCPERADLSLALEEAHRTAERNSLSTWAVSALGLAQYRNGLYEEARETLHRSMKLQWLPKPEDLFCLAMVEWQLGEKAAARSTFARAVERMDQTMPLHPPKVILKEEASRLLAID